ncbi:hypothetical protein ABPG74_016125 [Tetrahymena malaccensis]
MNNEIQRQENKDILNNIIFGEDDQEKLAQQLSDELENNSKSFKSIESSDYFQCLKVESNNQFSNSQQNERLKSTKSQTNKFSRQISDGMNSKQQDYEIQKTIYEKPNQNIQNIQTYNLDEATNSSQVQIKSKKNVQLKKKYNEYLTNKYLDGQKLFSANTKFYIYTDIVIDVDYFKNYSQKELYLNENKLYQIQKGFRFINQILHRFDNKFIEVDLEFFPSKLNNIEQIIFMLQSLGDCDLLPIITYLQQLWDTVEEFKILLKQESQDPLFKKHFNDRQQFCEQKCQEILSQLDQNEMVFFQYHIPNYEIYSFESRRVGYSPQLYNILAQNSYLFIDFLQKNGCYDPRTQIHQLESIFLEITQCLSAIKLGLLPKRIQNVQQTELVTYDKFVFPVQQTVDVYLVAHEYDQKHGLDFKSQYILSTYTFKFEDQKAYENFQKFRQQQQEQFQNCQKITQPEINYKNFENSQIQIIDKYYADSVANLYSFGSKWFKRCGYVDIPKKKLKKKNQN